MPSWDGQLVAADTCPSSKRSVSTTGLVGYTEIVYLVRMVESRTRRMIRVNAVASTVAVRHSEASGRALCAPRPIAPGRSLRYA